jgi:hypothetical protein
MKRMNHREDTEQLAPEDRRWVEAVGDAFRPEPLEAQRAAAFQGRLLERIERRRRVVRIAAPALALAAGALALWFSVAEPPAQANGSETLLYAFADPDGIAADLVEPDDYLPEDYRALASLLESDAEAP